VEGSWVWFRDFEITNSKPHRFGMARSRGADVYAPHSKLINLVIYYAGQGPGFWTQAVDSEIYGCLIFWNGHAATDNGHGHGVYTQNNTGVKQIRENIFFNPFGYIFHAYGSSNAAIKNYSLSGNVFFNGRFLVGGNAPAENILISENYYYRSPVELGYGNPDNKNLTFEKNIVASRVSARWWEGATIRNNLIVPIDQTPQDAALAVQVRPNGVPGDFRVDENEYYRGPKKQGSDFNLRLNGQSRNLKFPAWQGLGFDLHSAYFDAVERPAENKVILRINEYDPRRAHLVVFNWQKLEEVNIDLSPLQLQPGEVYEIRNVQNYFEEAITGTYNGELVKLPMTIWTHKPVVMTFAGKEETETLRGAETFPEFGVFVVTRWQQSVGLALPLRRTTGGAPVGGIGANSGARSRRPAALPRRPAPVRPRVRTAN
jgi:hypothetical protein